MKIRLLGSALEDLAGGRKFYDKQGEGLGGYFFDSLFADIDSLALTGGVHRKVFGCHRLLAKRFPYAVYYKTDGNTAVVWRVLDCRQDPQKIRRALGQL
jgi:plasmid stabilization system protein ParE